ncbi:preprotein translocase subunit YajC [Cryobacterium flavum]|uniref:Preprotein translocase subunit YajC n=1 Tax=Cryobacterium flavum TaxID=1424659 RepID=A0A4R8UZ20_9MICO|nr:MULTISPECIES: preprotein translocase subunit YajC [Cryobacterium]MDJ0377846.1 preprotein translocase subunit YajC [Cryobacterium sp. PH31-L1]TFB74545.1 preprotein translocase subunit YajC [Cryobacterium flavum]TFD09205.1 preprotein translocase subunit YajC [Cryobacterium sp. TMT1-66-1]TFD14986.1 preprotein translocase subunit YajC [Cryobacterium sp. TMT1-2-2]SDN20632.1 preprotein translocase subunit YajC [Cryobacterium flavum]
MDSLTLVMLAVLAVLVFFMFRNGRKRKRDQEALQATMVPGADVMTNFGMYGTIIAIDEEANKVELQIAPGVIVEIHRQTIARVVEPVVADELDDESVQAIDSLNEPEFGQRVADLDTDTTDQPKKGDA